MAPFSICSKCKARTRKVIKDPVTLKDIYLCPKCCKAKNEAQNIENEQNKAALLCSQQQEQPARELAKPMPQPKLVAPPKLPLAAATAATVNSYTRKCTPPVMQTVLIKGRKYIAITATASDN
ncbi:uncharacterized protein LOC111597179 [Drosophila hydei]|uniref:Uncharacterized protein LOC111597179 n=1 Tax=Drosophila hydei TaxID=7224 RepID=A0A6J1LLP9_DROHY|nr:uncharacterized protein LOC111597179 [Drosophila hydei]XP_023167523.1 uncharacterized protein LOC111597179 [Drosophila hydei]